MGQGGEEAPQSGSESLQPPISISEMTAVSQCPSDRSLGRGNRIPMNALQESSWNLIHLEPLNHQHCVLFSWNCSNEKVFDLDEIKLLKMLLNAFIQWEMSKSCMIWWRFDWKLQMVSTFSMTLLWHVTHGLYELWRADSTCLDSLIEKWNLLFQFSLSSEYENFTFTCIYTVEKKGQTES